MFQQIPHIRALLFSLLALSNKTKKRAKGSMADCQEKQIKVYLRKVNNALPQWIRSIQKPLIASSIS